jgi:glycosyltransferase involved in cell wall biosynthesis
MRVVHLAGYGGPYPGSFIPMLRAIMRAARARGCECEAVFTPISRERAWLAELQQDGIPFRFCPEGASRPELTRWVADLLAERETPTVLHTHFKHFDIACAVAGSRRERTAVLWHIHTPHFKGPVAFARNYLKYSLFGRRADQILCVSPDLVETITRRGAPRAKVEFIHNAVDTDRFPVLPAERRRAARKAVGMPNGRPLLVHFGWDWPRKGGDLFCESLAQLRGSGLDVTGVTVGGGEAAREHGARLGLGDDLVVLEPTDDVQAMYAAADVFVAPSRAEGTPFSVLEAVSSGTAAVVSDIPGHATVGTHAPACVITPLEPAAIAGATRELLQRDPSRAEADALAGHAWLRENLGLGPWAESLVDRYERLLGPAPARAAA